MRTGMFSSIACGRFREKHSDQVTTPCFEHSDVCDKALLEGDIYRDKKHDYYEDEGISSLYQQHSSVHYIFFFLAFRSHQESKI